MRTDSSLQKRNSCGKKSGWRRVVSVLWGVVGAVQIEGGDMLAG